MCSALCPHRYFLLLVAFQLCYVPMGMRLMLQMNFSHPPLTMFGTGDKGFLPNVDNRRSVQNLVATSPLAARLNNAHINQMEGFPFFAAGVLACMQAGVATTAVTDLAMLYIVARVAFVFFYIIGVNNFIANFRTISWLVVIVVQAKLFLLAAEAK